MKRTVGVAFVIIMCCALLSACGSGESSGDASGKPVIAVSIVPEESFVKAVCGDLVETVVMVPPGSSPENYEPTPMEMQKFSDAEVFFSIGVPTEANIMPSVSENTKVVSLDAACAAVYDDLTLGDERDPHIWLSPKRAIVMVNAIAAEMSGLYPENADIFSANAKEFIDRIEEADAEIRAVLDKLECKKFIVFHPAFGYLADDYGLEMFALEEEGKEATAAHMQEMIDLAKDEGIKVIFYQAEIDSRQSAAFAEELGGVTAKLEPLSGNYIENLKIMANTLAEAMSKYDA
ncbi:MAG: metal ABC transporter solute-binding protein, Zn/Mn family [Oscillospiraceae bacterium]